MIRKTGQERIWSFKMTNTTFRLCGCIGYGTLPDGTVFLFDADQLDRIGNTKWYRCHNKKYDLVYIADRKGRAIHRYLMECPAGYEIDHINLNTMDNRSCNLRVCTHQQNQCNQPLQRNNTSGTSGVSYFAPRGKYRARIKYFQRDIHLGYYASYVEAVQARNVGVEIMFGEFGQYNDVCDAPQWIRTRVITQCDRFKSIPISAASCVA